MKICLNLFEFVFFYLFNPFYPFNPCSYLINRLSDPEQLTILWHWPEVIVNDLFELIDWATDASE